MKLHKDGTVEGTPEEIAEYNRLVNNMAPRLCNWPPYTLKPEITSGGIQSAMTSMDQQRAYGHVYTGGVIQARPMFNSDTKPE